MAYEFDDAIITIVISLALLYFNRGLLGAGEGLSHSTSTGTPLVKPFSSVAPKELSLECV